MDLYFAITDFLKEVSPPDGDESIVKHATNYIMQTTLAAGYALCKLLNSSFVDKIPYEEGRQFLCGAVEAVRKMSVITNDLPQRLAEVLAQLWTNSVNATSVRSLTAGLSIDRSDPLQLKVRCRMSMSILFDGVWDWREVVQVTGRGGDLDSAVKNPTSPQLTNGSFGSPSVRAYTTLMEPSAALGPVFDDSAGLIQQMFPYDSLTLFDSLAFLDDDFLLHSGQVGAGTPRQL